MTVGEALSEGLSVTGTGLIIVFSVLIILMIVMMLMKVIFYKPQKQETQNAQKNNAEKTDVNISDNTKENDEELIAVITAAIAASLNTSEYNLKIKSFRRITDSQSQWNKAGVRDIIDSRF